MTGFLAVVRQTVSEALHRRLLVAMLVLTGVQLLLTAALVGSAEGLITVAGTVLKAHEEGQQVISMLFGTLAVLFYYPGLLMMCWMTAGFFPRMQEPGAIDLVLARPVPRPVLWIGRWTGCAVIALCASTLFFGGNYLVLGWKTGIWVPAFLLTIPASVFTYLAFLSLMATISLIGRSAALSAVAVTAYAVLIGPILLAASTAIGRTLMGDSAWGWLFDLLYNLLPRTAETGVTLFDSIRDGRVHDWAPLSQVGISAAAWLGLSTFWFSRKDY